MPVISVIMPVYNGEKYLRECLDSVVNQTLRDLEIICVNDGSTDSSLEILREYESRDARIRVLSQQNLNAGAARNLGLRYATGEYYSFLDADDFFEPDMLELAYNRARETDAEVLLFGSDSFFQDTETFEAGKALRTEYMPMERESFSGRDIRSIFSAIVGWPWDKLFKAEYIRRIGIQFQEQRTTNDLVFVFASVAYAERISVLEKVLAHHRRTGKDSLSVTREKSWYCFYDALLALRAQLIKWNCFEQFEHDFLNYCVVFSAWQLNTLAQPVKDILTYMLGRAWFEQLGVMAAPAETFDDPRTYATVQRIAAASSTLFKENVGKQAEELLRLRSENERIKASFSYRLGRAITWLPRKIRGGLLCVQDHGLGYTLKRGWNKLFRKMRG